MLNYSLVHKYVFFWFAIKAEAMLDPINAHALELFAFWEIWHAFLSSAAFFQNQHF